MAERRTIIRFSDGSMLELSQPPEQIAIEIEKARGELVRVLDSDAFPAWINPTYVVSVAVHPEHKEREIPSGM